MSTTRHLINRRRRVTARPAADPGHPDERVRRAADRTTAQDRAPRAPRARRRRAVPWAAVLLATTVLLGAFAAWAANEASARRDTDAARNTALTGTARTSAVSGAVTRAVGALFSYDHVEPGSTDKAVRTWLDGAAVRQHRDLLSRIRKQGAKEKLVLTTTVTDSGVERIEGDRARVLVYADQTNTRTAKEKDGTTYAAAMFAVDVERRGGAWKIVNFDTFRR
ncbi:hypothetical protein [Streptomyces boncukensis]|uniref:Mce-associated membrane protein n=1 Tax=Streptomyces boncukensis TaxID=2711219 RepID=A0A6G4WR30_9ACTN|nr:hypothetical protein [Streptomyces boncukensis]NGO67729.1 hypothetical protein [Streptomyces boncukensis]